MQARSENLQRLNDKPNFTIFIIDDLENIRKQLITDLRELGFLGEIIEAENLAIAKQILGTTVFNLVICDRNLPDGSGIYFLKTLRDYPHSAQIPFIMCTTVDDPTLIIKAIEAGANEYLTKPWTKEQLLKKIQTVVP
jgi:response regulator RpfG family c-di-GMP phosphodiesterase